MAEFEKIAVLISFYNRKVKTLACLNALFSVNIPFSSYLEVFLVDDGSTDGTSKAVKENFPKVHVIQGSGQLYWNRGMHLAWKTAINTGDFDYYLWLNDDVILFENAFSILFSTVQEHPNSIIVGCLQTEHETKATYGGFDASGLKIIPNGSPQKCHTFNGNVVLIPNLVYKKLGNLDPTFHHAIGDFDYALRAKQKGISCYITSQFTGVCEKNETLPGWCLPSNSIIKRLKSLYSPLGNSHPYYYFIFEQRHYGIKVALKHFATIHLRLFFPKLWKHQL